MFSAQNSPSPREFGIPHDEFRVGQYEALKYVLDNQGRYVFSSLCTGVGKSSVATGLGSQQPVLVLVHTLVLLTQYERAYNFSVVRGRQEYPCIHEKKIAVWRMKYGYSPKASECHYQPMHECEYANECPYVMAKREALRARRAACTYRYAGVSSNMQERGGHLAMDEAHDAAEELIGFNTFTVRHENLLHQLLPMFPIRTYGERNLGAVLTDESRGEVVAWIDKCLSKIAPRIDDTKEGADAQKMFDSYSRMGDSQFGS